MALRFFKEDYPGLHVIAAGSLLEFTLQELPTFGVGRIHTLFMYPMTFDEFLNANNENGLISIKRQADSQHPLDAAFHEKLIEYFRIYLLVGGMPEAVLAWIKTHNFNQCSHIQEDIILTYEDDFSKYMLGNQLLSSIFADYISILSKLRQNTADIQWIVMNYQNKTLFL